MAQIRSGSVGDELALGRLAAASPLASEAEQEQQPKDEQPDGAETPEKED